MSEQLIAFVDLLGFGSIVEAQDDSHHAQILSLLTDLAKAKREAELKRITVDAVNSRIDAAPAISAFSDHIVFSFPGDQLEQLGTGPIIWQVTADVARIFRRAIGIGCLVRGGITIGQLHHDAHVVFGPGLVEAYKLESKFAGRARVILSAKAVKRIGKNPFLRCDDDGFSYIDYVREAYDQVTKGLIGAERETESRNWVTDVRKHCEDQISALTEKGNLAGLQNWRWFLNRFERFVAKPANGF